MNQLEIDYPDVTFIYMTGHLDGTGESGNLHIRNNQIRQYCLANNKILFDFADIESYDPDGNYFLDLNADDNCDYDGGNWAQEWCAEHPNSELCWPCTCAHSQSLNCNLKGRAFWWMMARIGSGAAAMKGDFDADGDIDIFDFAAFADAYGSEVGDPNYNAIGDFNNDGDIDIFDFVAFAEVYGYGT